MMIRRRLIVWASVSMVGLLLGLGLLPLGAQDAVFMTNTPAARLQAFATNTPSTGAQPLFVTNTPPALIMSTPEPLLLATNTPQANWMNAAPDAPIGRYALRRWDDSSLTLAWIDQVRRVTADSPDRIMALRLFQQEITRRFPGTPRSAANREALLNAMLAAPVGSVDVRPVIRPYVEAALNELQPPYDVDSTIVYKNLTITIAPANLDGRVGKGAVVFIGYTPDNGSPTYRDVAMAIIDEQGVYRVPQSQSPYPVVSSTVHSSGLVDNLNGDSLNELSLTVMEMGDINGQLYVYGWRGGQPVNLVEPGKQVIYAGTQRPLSDGSGFAVDEYRLDDPAWGCTSSRAVVWRWQNNFFRPPTTLPDFTPLNTLACNLSAAEPLYAMPPADALRLIGNLTAQATADDAAAAGRAAIMVAMLNVLDGKPDVGIQQIAGLSTGTQPGTWLDDQVQAFKQAAAAPNSTPLTLCAALEAASEYGACDVNAVLTRLFAEQPFSRDTSIETQAAGLGLQVVNQTTIKEVGKVDRPAYLFDLTGDQWWSFGPLGKDQYTAEAIDTPIGFEAPQAALPNILTPPQTAYDALLVRNDPAEALNILDTLQRSRAGTPMDSAGRFLRALSLDLLGDRRAAQPAYYELWSEDPTSVWGQLAAAHLERR
ncbi:MAG: hypothetical protein LCI00_09010 [Chloroflexi bacterium]|nr:hypothetical protein [Chloroflexota bacterium]MCC6893138.1 hypothetical protein [Anaerolineae bacterium]